MDDVTPFGTDKDQVKKLIGLLRDPQQLLSAEEQAMQLFRIIPKEEMEIAAIGYGGALTYTLLSREGLDLPFTMLDAQRNYTFITGEKRPRIKCDISGGIAFGSEVSLLIDDVVASGQTMYASSMYLGRQFVNAAALVMSGDVRSNYRSGSGSSASGIDTLYASQIVNGKGGFPAILSLRFVLLKTEYSGNLDYLLKYAKPENKQELEDLLRSKIIDIEQLRLLYRNPRQFVREQSNGYR